MAGWLDVMGWDMTRCEWVGGVAESDRVNEHGVGGRMMIDASITNYETGIALRCLFLVLACLGAWVLDSGCLFIFGF